MSCRDPVLDLELREFSASHWRTEVRLLRQARLGRAVLTGVPVAIILETSSSSVSCLGSVIWNIFHCLCRIRGKLRIFLIVNSPSIWLSIMQILHHPLTDCSKKKAWLGALLTWGQLLLAYPWKPSVPNQTISWNQGELTDEEVLYILYLVTLLLYNITVLNMPQARKKSWRTTSTFLPNATSAEEDTLALWCMHSTTCMEDQVPRPCKMWP